MARTIAWRAGVGRVLLALASVALGWVLTEMAARALLGPPPARIEDRVVVFSRPHWHSWGDSLRYAPHGEIRTAALYGGKFEYDVVFPTNNLGLVDPHDYWREPPPGRERRWLFVGDSFTAGFHGGLPWVPRLRDRARRRDREVEIYNGGVGATGFPQFASLVTSLGRQLDFGRVAVLFITDNLYRQHWRPFEHEGLLRVCPTLLSGEQCRAMESRILLLDDPTLARAEILALARRRGLLVEASTPREWLARHTFAAFLLRTSLATGARSEGSEEAEQLLEDLAHRSVRDLARALAGRDAVLLQIPERDETQSGRYREDHAEALRSAGLVWVSLLDACGFETDDYFSVDPHFNARGYDKLMRCVGDVLDLL